MRNILIYLIYKVMIMKIFPIEKLLLINKVVEELYLLM
jgi:hypothetical protein